MLPTLTILTSPSPQCLCLLLLLILLVRFTCFLFAPVSNNPKKGKTLDPISISFQNFEER